jgi:hypothetical protein
MFVCACVCCCVHVCVCLCICLSVYACVSVCVTRLSEYKCPYVRTNPSLCVNFKLKMFPLQGLTGLAYAWRDGVRSRSVVGALRRCRGAVSGQRCEAQTIKDEHFES